MQSIFRCWREGHLIENRLGRFMYKTTPILCTAPLGCTETVCRAICMGLILPLGTALSRSWDTCLCVEKVLLFYFIPVLGVPGVSSSSSSSSSFSYITTGCKDDESHELGVCGMSVSCCYPRLMAGFCRVRFCHLSAVAEGVDSFVFFS